MSISPQLARVVSPLLDPCLVGSFDRLGYRLHQAAFFDPSDLSVDLSGKTYLVTGANSGIGEATAQGLAERGGTVWMLCRSRTRAEQARARAPVGARDRLHVAALDVSHLEAVRAFCEGLSVARIDGLIHNAGVLPATYGLTPEGLEQTLATNLVGPYLLTRLLLPRLLASPDARLIFVSSGGMYSQRLAVDRLSPAAADRFDGVAAYARTKRAQVVLAEELARRVSLKVYSMHPGWADTPAVRTSLPTFHRLTRAILRTPAQGADTVLWLAASAAAGAAPSGQFWFDRRPQSTHRLPWTREAPGERARLLERLDVWSGGLHPLGGAE